MKSYGSFDMAEGTDIKNLTAPSGTAFPVSPNIGELFYRTDLLTLYSHNGTTWIAAPDDSAVVHIAGTETITGAKTFTNFGASTITATSSTTARSLAGRAAEVLNVLDYGADKTGAITSTTAFQAVVDAAGTTGRTIYIPDGTYLLSTPVILPHNAKCSIVGASEMGVTIRGGGSYCFGSDTTWNAAKLVANISFKNLTFDGQHVRGAYPYMDATGDSYGISTALFLSGDSESSTSSVVIDSCRFLRIASLPILFDHFAKVSVTNTEFYKTRDPGFRYCDKVIFSDNSNIFGSDNFVSVSRGCRDVTISGNNFKDCESAGVWFSGFDVAQTGTVTAIGSTYAAGDTVTLNRSSGSWNTSDKNVPITLTAGADKATFQIISINTATAANAIAVDSVPATLQNTAASWSYSPHFGVDTISITNNVVSGGLTGGITGYSGSRKSNITGNVVLRTGFMADSEIFTSGTIANGSAVLHVANGALFTVNDLIIIDPHNSLGGEYLIAKVQSIATNDITLTASTTRTYANVNVHLCRNSTTARAMQITGIASGSTFAEGGKGVIQGNYIEDYVEFGILLGSSGGTVSNMLVSNNYISIANTIGASANRRAVKLSESTGQNASNIFFFNNVHTDSVGAMFDFNQNDANVRSTIIMDGNTVIGGAARTTAHASAYDGRWNMDGARQVFNNIDFRTWATAAVATNNVAITNTLNTLNEVGVATVNTFTSTATATGLPMFWVRNISASAVTITHNASFVRNLTGTNVTLNMNECAGYVFVTSTIVQQVAGKMDVLPTTGGTISGNLTVTGNLITQGNVTLGDAITDTVTITSSNVNLEMMNASEQGATLTLGRTGATDRDMTISVFNSVTAASNYMKFNVHNGTVGARVTPLELYGDGSIKLPLVGTSGFVKLGAGGVLSADTTTYATDSLVVHLAGTETITGAKTFSSSITINNQVSNSALVLTGIGNASIEMGRTDGTTSTPLIDFHSGATSTDYDSRIIATGGTGVAGGGSLQIIGATLNLGSSSLTSTINLGATTTSTQLKGAIFINDATPAVVGRVTGDTGVFYLQSGSGAGDAAGIMTLCRTSTTASAFATLNLYANKIDKSVSKTPSVSDYFSLYTHDTVNIPLSHATNYFGTANWNTYSGNPSSAALYASLNISQIGDGTVNFANMFGLYSRLDVSSATTTATIPTWRGVHVNNVNVPAGATLNLTDWRGVHIDNLSSGGTLNITNAYGIYSNITAATGRWNIYVPGTAPNYFGTEVYIGSNTDLGAYNLQVTGDSIHTGSILATGADVTRNVTVTNTSSTAARFPALVVDNYSSTFTGHGVIELRRSKGSQATPASVVANDILGGFDTWGHNGTSFISATRIEGIATNTFSTSVDADIRFLTTLAGTQTERARLDSSGNFNFKPGSITGNFYAGQPSAGNPGINWDTNDYIVYDRTANALSTFIGGATQLKVSAGALTLNNTTSNWIDFGTNGATAIPSITGATRSAGNKLVLSNNFVQNTNIDVAIGTNGTRMWFTSDTSATAFEFWGRLVSNTMYKAVSIWGGSGETSIGGNLHIGGQTGTGGDTGGVIDFNGLSPSATSNWVDFGTVGLAAPAITTRSVGTKLVLRNTITASTVDFAIGVDTSTFWQSVDTTTSSFKWYAGTNNILTLAGTGAMTMFGSISATGAISTPTVSILDSGATTQASKIAAAPVTTTSTTQTTIDSFSTGTYRSAEWMIQVTSGTVYQSSKMTVLHDGTTTFRSETSVLNTGASLGTFTTDISAGSVRLRFTAASASSTTVKAVRIAVTV